MPLQITDRRILYTLLALPWQKRLLFLLSVACIGSDLPRLQLAFAPQFVGLAIGGALRSIPQIDLRPRRSRAHPPECVAVLPQLLDSRQDHSNNRGKEGQPLGGEQIDRMEEIMAHVFYRGG